jgi:hypothetical protein
LVELIICHTHSKRVTHVKTTQLPSYHRLTRTIPSSRVTVELRSRTFHSIHYLWIRVISQITTLKLVELTSAACR